MRLKLWNNTSSEQQLHQQQLYKQQKLLQRERKRALKQQQQQQLYLFQQQQQEEIQQQQLEQQEKTKKVNPAALQEISVNNKTKSTLTPPAKPTKKYHFNQQSMGVLTLLKRDDGRVMPPGAASRIVLRIQLKGRTSPDPLESSNGHSNNSNNSNVDKNISEEQLTAVSSRKLQSAACTLLHSVLINNALQSLSMEDDHSKKSEKDNQNNNNNNNNKMNKKNKKTNSFDLQDYNTNDSESLIEHDHLTTQDDMFALDYLSSQRHDLHDDEISCAGNNTIINLSLDNLGEDHKHNNNNNNSNSNSNKQRRIRLKCKAVVVGADEDDDDEEEEEELEEDEEVEEEGNQPEFGEKNDDENNSDNTLNVGDHDHDEGLEVDDNNVSLCTASNSNSDMHVQDDSIGLDDSGVFNDHLFSLQSQYFPDGISATKITPAATSASTSKATSCPSPPKLSTPHDSNCSTTAASPANSPSAKSLKRKSSCSLTVPLTGYDENDGDFANTSFDLNALTATSPFASRSSSPFPFQAMGAYALPVLSTIAATAAEAEAAASNTDTGSFSVAAGCDYSPAKSAIATTEVGTAASRSDTAEEDSTLLEGDKRRKRRSARAQSVSRSGPGCAVEMVTRSRCVASEDYCKV